MIKETPVCCKYLTKSDKYCFEITHGEHKGKILTIDKKNLSEGVRNMFGSYRGISIGFKEKDNE